MLQGGEFFGGHDGLQWTQDAERLTNVQRRHRLAGTDLFEDWSIIMQAYEGEGARKITKIQNSAKGESETAEAARAEIR
jgi:alpha-D-ribose 1-methylphosphonate 5-phosphate C-P lyase